MATEIDAETAGYVLSLPDRCLGDWDGHYIEVVTGYHWDQGLETVFRSIPTHLYLVESERFHHVLRAAGMTPEQLDRVVRRWKKLRESA